MTIDIEILKIILTALGTLVGTMLTMAKWFHSNLRRLSSEISALKESISRLDKNLAVQTALMERIMEKRRG